MVDPPALPAEPVFVVCNARSGSTLLRYLLDVHPDVACPAETKVVATIRALLAVRNDLDGNPTTEQLTREHGLPKPTPASVAGTRNVIVATMSEYLERRQARVWCDKSLDTVHGLDVIRLLFPRARFLCLHRHAMDVVASLLESCRWGYGYFDLQPYIARRYNNFPTALAEYWTVRTNLMLRLQQSDATTHAVHYEHLVRDPVGTLTGILTFLGLAADPSIVRAMVDSAFRVEHDPGAADWKIPFASTIEQRSVERGRAIPQELIRPPIREQMNGLLAMLHYPVVDADWNTASEVSERTNRTLLGDGAGARARDLVDGLLAPRLARYAGPAVRRARLVVTYGDNDRMQWVIDAAAATVTPDDGRADAALTITTRAEVLQAVLVGGLPVQSAWRLKMLVVAGAVDETERLAVSRFLTDLLSA